MATLNLCRERENSAIEADQAYIVYIYVLYMLSICSKVNQSQAYSTVGYPSANFQQFILNMQLVSQTNQSPED